MDAKVAGSTTTQVLEAPETCWRIEQARRVAFLLDAQHYYDVLHEALQRAERSVFLVGWDFNHRIRLRPGDPYNIGQLLSRLIHEKPRLRIHVLIWDSPVVFELRRGTIPFRLLNALSADRLQYQLDDSCPTGACQHQKIVVIDECLAFCGGIDLTDSRWDTRAHADDQPARRTPGGRAYDPYHDMMLAIDGSAARALAELARERWRRATGEVIAAPGDVRECWPESLAADMEGVPVGIARTEPQCDGRPEVREVESLYVAAIGSARESIYIENQYFASHRVFEALARRLGEPGGPEIIVLNPKTYAGVIEQQSMGELRTRVVSRLRRTDTGGRFAIYAPVTAEGVAITVHAKTLVVDDRLVRIGSANLSNRSMGFDSECDIAIDADTTRDPTRARAVIAAYRNGLLAEHLGTTLDQVVAAIEAGGSLLGAIDRLNDPNRRRLVPVDIGADADDGKPIESPLDPESAAAALAADPNPLSKAVSKRWSKITSMWRRLKE